MHLAGCLRTGSMVFAFLRILRLHRSGREFAVGGAEALVATSHAVGLPSGGPKGSPKQNHGEEAHKRGKFSSRSERKIKRLSHGLTIVIVTWYWRAAPCGTAKDCELGAGL